jgi:hypothetical protein
MTLNTEFSSAFDPNAPQVNGSGTYFSPRIPPTQAFCKFLLTGITTFNFFTIAKDSMMAAALRQQNNHTNNSAKIKNSNAANQRNLP